MLTLFIRCYEDKSLTTKPEPIEQPNDGLANSIIGEWGPEFRGFGWYILFRDNENYEERFSGEGCGGYKGKYSLENDYIKLKPNEKEDCINEERLKENLCKIQASPKSLYSDRKIVCGKSELYSVKDQKKDGTVLSIDSRKVIAVQPNVFFTKDIIYFREGPGVNFKSISCGVERVAYDIRMQTLPENTFLFVIARTPEKYKVNNKEDYWYYVKPNTGWHSSGCYQKLGWVFGAFIKPGAEE
ncbi:MAG: hypothetical protein SFU98_19060 [Leptospiraceae bacterium]|nr:hypothetical protein [Leptospiraceae bacterium]